MGVPDQDSVLIAGIVGGGILLGLTAIVGGFLHARRERLLAHAERIKAMELGRDLPDDPATARLRAVYRAEAENSSVEPGASRGPRAPASHCYSTTGYLCATGFVFAFLSGASQAVAVAIAAATGALGVTGMICGTILAGKAAGPTAADAPAKVRFDPEAV